MTVDQLRQRLANDEIKSLFVELIDPNDLVFAIRPCDKTYSQIVEPIGYPCLNVGSAIMQSNEISLFNRCANLCDFLIQFNIVFGRKIDFQLCQRFLNEDIVFQRILDINNDNEEIWFYSIG